MVKCVIVFGILLLLPCAFCTFDAEFLSWNPVVIHIPNFLSESECDLLIDEARKSSQYRPNDPKDQSVYLEMYPKLSPQLKKIEDKLGVITGQPPHPGEEAINIHHIKRVSEVNSVEGHAEECLNQENSNALSCKLGVHSMHHDKVQKEYSSVTVVVYLNDVDIGGGTVFPCLAQSKKDIKKMQDICANAFDQGGRWFDGNQTVSYGKFYKHRAAANVADPLREILIASHYGCLEPTSSRPSIRTKAKKGHAAVFYHNYPDLSPVKMAWHAGCLPVSGDKWTLQKFKEFPSVFRKPIDYPMNSEQEVQF